MKNLARVCEWLCKNSMSINVGKTKCMVMGKPRFKEEAEAQQTVRLMGSNLEWVRKYKYLGVILDNNLSFKEHVEYINSKMAKQVNLLYKLRKVISKSGKELLFKTILVPHLRYCSAVLTMANKKDIASIQRNFNRGMRAVLNKRRSENVSGMLKELGYLPVESEVQRDVLTFIYRLEQKQLPKYLEGLVRKNSDLHMYSTRQASKFHLEPVHYSRGLKSVFSGGIALYNELPDEIKSLGSVGLFRQKVGIWLSAQEYEIVKN